MAMFIRLAALSGFLFIITASGLNLRAAAQSGGEAAFIAQIGRLGLAAAPNDFRGIRGSRIGTTLYRVTGPLGRGPFPCRIVDMSGSARPSWELQCRSAPHRQSVEDLAAFVKRAVSANIPKILDDFSQDDDSIGDLNLGWQHTYSYPLAVYAYVSSIWKTERDAKGTYSVAGGSYYVLHISHERRP